MNVFLKLYKNNKLMYREGYLASYSGAFNLAIEKIFEHPDSNANCKYDIIMNKDIVVMEFNENSKLTDVSGDAVVVLVVDNKKIKELNAETLKEFKSNLINDFVRDADFVKGRMSKKYFLDMLNKLFKGIKFEIRDKRIRAVIPFDFIEF